MLAPKETDSTVVKCQVCVVYTLPLLWCIYKCHIMVPVINCGAKKGCLGCMNLPFSSQPGHLVGSVNEIDTRRVTMFLNSAVVAHIHHMSEGFYYGKMIESFTRCNQVTINWY